MKSILEVLEYVRTEVLVAKENLYTEFMCNIVYGLWTSSTIGLELAYKVDDYIWDNIPDAAVETMLKEFRGNDEYLQEALEAKSGAWFSGGDYTSRLDWLDKHIKLLKA